MQLEKEAILKAREELRKKLGPGRARGPALSAATREQAVCDKVSQLFAHSLRGQPLERCQVHLVEPTGKALQFATSAKKIYSPTAQALFVSGDVTQIDFDEKLAQEYAAFDRILKIAPNNFDAAEPAAPPTLVEAEKSLDAVD